MILRLEIVSSELPSGESLKRTQGRSTRDEANMEMRDYLKTKRLPLEVNGKVYSKLRKE